MKISKRDRGKKKRRKDNVDNSMTVAQFNFGHLLPVSLGSYAITKNKIILILFVVIFYQNNSEVRKETLDLMS